MSASSHPEAEKGADPGDSSAAGAAAPLYYRPQPASSRDLRLDLLRGLCLFKMVFDHLWLTPLHVYRDWIGFVTAAEGFFLISGAVVGIVYGRRLLELGQAAVTRALWRRAAKLYIANLVLVLSFALLEELGILHGNGFAAKWESGARWWALLQLDQPYFLHVLPRYVVFLLLAPAALWCMRKKLTVLLIAVSVGLYWLRLHHLFTPVVKWLEPGPTVFPVLSWQLVFLAGMVMGYHRRWLARCWRAVPTWLWLVLFMTGSIAFAGLKQADLHGLVRIQQQWSYLMFGREHLGQLRILNFVLVAGLCFLVTDRLWRPLDRVTGWMLIPFGQNSLYFFLVHLVVLNLGLVLGVHTLPVLVTPWGRLLLDALVIALIWWMIRRRVLFRVIPR